MIPSDSNQRLSATLGSWRVTPPRDPNFRPAVLERIQPRRRATWAEYIRSHGGSWSAAALLAISAAGWTGHALAGARLQESREQMVVSYLGKLDPRVLAKLRD